MGIRFCHAAAALLVASACSGAAVAQSTPAAGTVTLKQDDGEAIPVRNALVDIYRTDIKGDYHVKTDTNGRYVHPALPLVGTFTLVFSAPGARPSVVSGCRFAQHSNLKVVLEPGDGRRPSFDEARAGALPCGTLAVNPWVDETARSAEGAALQAAAIDLASLFASGRIDETISESRKVLAARPDDIEANLYLGLALFGSRDEEGATFLVRFLDRAPDTHPRKASAQAMLDEYRSRLPAASAVAQPPKPTRRRP
jgi:hypothetical protein